MKKGEIYEGVITGYDFPNKASLKLPKSVDSDEMVKVTIKGALPGQKVRFMISKKKAGMVEGRLLEVLEKSPLEDSDELCPYFGMCGGCAYQSMSYDNQLKLKEDMVKKLLAPYITDKSTTVKSFENSVAADDAGTTGISSDCIWEGILSSPVRTNYRNKMEFTFGDEYKDGPLALGLHKKGGFYDILNVKECKIINSDWGAILEYTENFFREKNVPFYHKLRHEGVLRNLVVRQSKASGEFLINLVASTQWEKYGIKVESDEELSAGVGSTEGGSKDEKVARQIASDRGILGEYVAGLVKLADSADFAGSIAGILYTANDSLGDVVQSDKTYVLYGRDFIEEEILGLKFKISPFSFFQTNSKGCEVLYEKAREYIMSGAEEDIGNECKASETVADNGCSEKGGLDKDASGKLRGKVVFDLYSGTGTIAQMMAPASGKVIGIEIVEEAVEAARENAKLNGLDNCEFIAGDVLKAIDLVEEKPDLIILDPPRDGINPKALDKILAFGVDEMVYISCKPTSLARDLEIITGRGYKVVKACAVDQFPGTVHVETVTLLTHQKKPDDFLRIHVDLDELDLTKSESKATYEMVREYVKNNYNMHVTNLYIAQVKRDFGIIERVNYNVGEGKSRVPQCPKDKYDAIVEALKHFQMIE